MDETREDPMAAAPWERLDEAPLPAATVENGLAFRSGVIYASRWGFRPLELDLIAPESALSGTGRPVPLVVWIHGGAFALGSRHVLPEFLERADFLRTVASAGYVVASIDYRLSSEARWPAPLLDVRSAVRWLQRRSDELGVDPNAVAVWGESAGGHLALMAAFRGHELLAEEPAGAPLPQVAAVVDWYGPTDFSLMDEQAGRSSDMGHDDPDSPESQLLGAPVQSVPDRVADANPLRFVGEHTPPVHVRHGRLDRLVPFGQSQILVEELHRAGASVDWRAVEDAGHVFVDHPTPEMFIDEALRFLDEYLVQGSDARTGKATS